MLLSRSHASLLLFVNCNLCQMDSGNLSVVRCMYILTAEINKHSFHRFFLSILFFTNIMYHWLSKSYYKITFRIFCMLSLVISKFFLRQMGPLLQCLLMMVICRSNPLNVRKECSSSFEPKCQCSPTPPYTNVVTNATTTF